MSFYKKENGTTTVEFALIIILVLSIVFGIIEFGLAIYNKQVLTNAAREGARVGIVFSLEDESTINQRITNRVLDFCQNYLVTFGANPSTALKGPWISYREEKTATNPNPKIIPRNQTKLGSIIIVRVTYDYSFLFLSRLGLGPLQWISEVKMTMEGTR